MTKYTLDATVMLTLEQVTVSLDEPANGEDEFEDALMSLLNDRLVLLDNKGGRSGESGFISTIECESVDNWSRD